MTVGAQGTGLGGLRAWTLTEGHAGMESQTRALAAALGFDPVVKRAVPPRLLAALPAPLWPAPLWFANRGGADLGPPWPDLLISCGRRSIAAALAVRRASGGRTYLVHIGHAYGATPRFDAVLVPTHDGIKGKNVVTCLGSVHGLTPDRLAAEADVVAARFADLPRPLVTVLVGGANRAYGMGAREIAALGEALAALTAKQGCGLAVLTSRRTGAENTRALAERLASLGAFVWDGSGPNPYLALIGLADALVVTCDSVNMVSEAAATGKPVYVQMYPGRSARFDAFHAAMRTRGHTRAFEGEIDFDWHPEPLHETAMAAAEIARRYRAARGG
jgi:mitochondrial fission protein ELM1